MLEQIKKNWFVLVVAAVLLIASGFYISNQRKSIATGKKVDGEQVVFSIAGQNFLATDYQSRLDEIMGDATLYQIFERELLSGLDLDEDLKVDARLRAESALNYIKQSQGTQGLNSLEKELVALGYEGIDSLSEYYGNVTKYEILVKDYFMAHYDTLFKDYVEESKPRLVSHILISMEDPKNPTEDEVKAMQTVDQALADGKKFADVAYANSDDTSSAENGGSLGVVDADTSLVESFLEATLALNKGETSTWIFTDYGAHLIYVEETDFKTLLNNNHYLSLLTEENGTEVGNAIWEVAQASDIEFNKVETEEKIKTILGVNQKEATE